MASLLDAVQNVLTKGIDAAATVKLARLQVNDPTFNTVGPYGQSARAGQGTYGVGDAIASVPPVVWIGGAVLIVGLLIFRRR